MQKQTAHEDAQAEAHTISGSLWNWMACVNASRHRTATNSQTKQRRICTTHSLSRTHTSYTHRSFEAAIKIVKTCIHTVARLQCTHLNVNKPEHWQKIQKSIAKLKHTRFIYGGKETEREKERNRAKMMLLALVNCPTLAPEYRRKRKMQWKSLALALMMILMIHRSSLANTFATRSLEGINRHVPCTSQID